MTKKVFIAAFVLDEDYYRNDYPDAKTDKDNVVCFLSAMLGEDGLSDFIVWDSAEDFVLDHMQRGPINLAYLQPEEPQ